MQAKMVLLWLLGIALVGAFIIAAGGDDVVWVARHVDPIGLALLFFLQMMTLGVSAYQWHRLLRSLGAGIGFMSTFRIHLSSAFVESVTPSVKVGGEAAKIYLSRRATGLPGDAVLGAAMAHKYLSLLPFLLVLIPVIGAAGAMGVLSRWVVYAFLILFAVFALFFATAHRHGGDADRVTSNESDGSGLWGAYARKMQRFLQTARGAGGYSRALTRGSERWTLLGLSTIVWLLYPVTVYLVAQMLGLGVRPLSAAISTYSAYVLSMIPLTPGGLGTFEGAMSLMLARGSL